MTTAVFWRRGSTRFPIITRVATALWGLLLLVGVDAARHYSTTNQTSVVFPVLTAMIMVWLELTRPRGYAASSAPVVVATSVVVAKTNALTGLLNRAAFTERHEAACATGERILLAFVDLNGFTDVNDPCGHRQGNHVLSELAVRLLRAERSEDVDHPRFRAIDTNDSSPAHPTWISSRSTALDAPPVVLGPSRVDGSGLPGHHDRSDASTGGTHS